MNENSILQIATIAAGCFWGIEDSLRRIRGFKSTVFCYTGGWFPNPTYDIVCTDRTGHAEAVQVHYDPKEIAYEELLKVFWSIHNPTTRDCQGLDVGKQYRSMILFHTPEQESIAKRSMEELEKSAKFKNKVVTEIVPASRFFKAEEYHENYYQNRGGRSCYF